MRARSPEQGALEDVLFDMAVFGAFSDVDGPGDVDELDEPEAEDFYDESLDEPLDDDGEDIDCDEDPS